MDMRLRPVLIVSDRARKVIAKLRPEGQRTARGAKASRDLVISYVQERLHRLSDLAPWWDDSPLSEDDLEDARSAVAYLRSSGKTDSEIKSWLLVQRARYDLRTLAATKPR
jgi:hypothetical protein